jgi:four helix bundle protein
VFKSAIAHEPRRRAWWVAARLEGLVRVRLVTAPARGAGMNTNPHSSLPHHRLVAYQVAVELLVLVRDARLRDAQLREQALRSAKSVCLNIAEATGRVSRADQARVFGIARGEVVETCAAVELAGLLGGTSEETVQTCTTLCARLAALLTGLMR